jgi:phytanoyl-CoA hydroxylase
MDIEQLFEQYTRDGYVILPAALDADEIAELRATTDRVSEQARGLSEENAVFDFESGHTPEAPLIQRIKKPHRVDPYYFALARHPKIMPLVQRLCGENLRLSHSKINMKSALAGSPLQWHQDWAFAPHTNMSTCVVSVMLDETREGNGAMQVIPGSHLGPLYEHHDPELGFVGAIDVEKTGLDLSTAVSLVGAPGTISFHHPMTIHGSGANRSTAPRRILFLEYAATDAYPLFYSVDWDEYNSRIVHGEPSSHARVEVNPVKLPFPSSAGSSIYKTQAKVRSPFFVPAA